MSIYSERLEFYSRLFVKEVIESVMKHGLVDEQHFYVCFNMNCQGLIFSDNLKAKYRSDNNIIILLRKGEYENLKADPNETGFFVDLLMQNEQSERVFITYSSIVSFVDPSQNFSLEFTPINEPQVLSCSRSNGSVPVFRDNVLIFPMPMSG